MTVQDTVRTVTVPRQTGPADAPRTPADAAARHPASASRAGRDRPLTADERQFAAGLVFMVVVLGTIIVAGLLLAQYAWT